MNALARATVAMSLGLLPTACAELAGVGDRDRLTDDAGADALVDGAGDEQLVQFEEPPAEVCNFASDAFDGRVDQGFDWVIGTWQPGPAVTNAGALKAVALANGRVAVALIDEQSARLRLFVVDGAGVVAAGPVEVSTSAKLSGFGIAAAGSVEIGVAFALADGQCSPGCVVLARFDAVSLESKGSRAVDPSAAGQSFEVTALYDLGWSSAGYIALAFGPDAQPRIVMVGHIGEKFGSPQWTGVFGVGGPALGALTIGPEIGWVLSGEAAGMAKVAFGIVSLGGYVEILSPQ